MALVKDIYFAPLKRYSTLFKMLIILKRVQMIAVRLLFVGFFIYIFSVGELEFSGSFSLDGLLQFAFIWWIATTFGPLLWSNKYWTAFAHDNKFSIPRRAVTSDGYPQQSTPSFHTKKLALSPMAIVGQLDRYNFRFWPRMYKEGGLLRWRERKMDTVLKIEGLQGLTASLPHIVINATANERARRSNLARNSTAPGNSRSKASTVNITMCIAARRIGSWHSNCSLRMFWISYMGVWLRWT